MNEPVMKETLSNNALTAEELKLARLIVSSLNLEMPATEIDPTAPLYGEGMGLDSIDILEVALAISKAYGVKLRSDDEHNRKIFTSLRSLNQHIQQHRVK
jgi:acyl carrier protein